MPDWSFYGRAEPLAQLTRVIDADRWFFCRIEGRRRIGKTTLLGQLARLNEDLGSKLLYMQVPDSDERDVAATFRRSLGESERLEARNLAASVSDFASMADAIGHLCTAGLVVVIDEFQYFTRAKLHAFNSFLQATVDKLRNAQLKQGGLFVLGSLQSDMSALLDDRAAPLFGRITAQLKLDHWDFADLMSLYRSQGLERPSDWLTLWTFFEGVPKFYHDAFEQRIFELSAADFARELLARMFVHSSSPLSEEAETWFLRELRGRAISILNYLAQHSGCNHADLVSALNDPQERTPLGTQISRLVNDYRMVDKLLPVFANEKSRNARYYIADNFLKAWLAVAKPAREAARLKPLEKALAPAMRHLETLEGYAFEKWIKELHLEMSRKGKGDFELSDLKLGYWNRPRDVSKNIEIDLVALDEANKKIRFGSCKRSASSHDLHSLSKFDQQVEAFLMVNEHRRLRDWRCERAVFSPVFDTAQRTELTAKGYLCRDLCDYARLV